MLSYKVSLRCLDFRNKVGGEHFTVSYVSRFLPSTLGHAMATACCHGVISSAVCDMSEPVSVRFERVWIGE